MSLDQLHALDVDADSINSVGDAVSLLSYWFCH